jgi:8-oxo-dGTP pyrophosphatase MutT (NUDIX family)
MSTPAMSSGPPAGDRGPIPPMLAVSTVPLWIAGSARGRLIDLVAGELRRMPDLFVAAGDGVRLRDDGLDAAARGELLQQAAVRLRAASLVPGWRNEFCELLDAEGIELARFERGAFRTLGLQNRAVHVNAWLPSGRLWIARRSPHKASSPNKLDNLAAGAIAAGETQEVCAVRELWEEAGVPASLAALTTFPGRSLHSLRPLRHGIHDEVVICADLALPESFVPDCQDGEVAEFLCMTGTEVRAALVGGEFSVEAGMVVADWLARHRAGA